MEPGIWSCCTTCRMWDQHALKVTCMYSVGLMAAQFLNTLDSVERYSVEENEWKKVSVIPETVITPQVAVIRMPRKYLV